jgi:murein L,D-transpeptidase YafK
LADAGQRAMPVTTANSATVRAVVAAADEAVLIEALEAVGSGDLDQGLSAVEGLVLRNPKFRLAQLVYSDLLLAKARPITGFGARAGRPSSGLAQLLDEARARLRARDDGARGDRLPEGLLRVSPSQRHAIVVDVARSRLYLFGRGDRGPILLRSAYVSTGKAGSRKRREGDQRTPVGVYFLTGRISPRELPDFYGSGALPVNYPNEWDLRLGRTGYGIWIHGVPNDTYSRPPRASDGCMALPNEDLSALWSLADSVRTPVIIADDLDWRPRTEVAARAQEFSRVLNRWLRAWESRSVARYAEHYAADFRGDGLDRVAWLRHKRRLNAGKSWIRVSLSDVSILGYPGEKDVLVVTFEQNYRSSNFRDRSRKRQYWRRDADGAWRIIHEGPARFLKEHLRGIPFSARAGMLSAVN